MNGHKVLFMCCGVFDCGDNAENDNGQLPQ